MVWRRSGQWFGIGEQLQRQLPKQHEMRQQWLGCALEWIWAGSTHVFAEVAAKGSGGQHLARDAD
eukprot:6995788-Lingulodinium_polyedra.AAC.1